MVRLAQAKRKVKPILEHWTIREARKKKSPEFKRRSQAAKKGWVTRLSKRFDLEVTTEASREIWRTLLEESGRRGVNDLFQLRQATLGKLRALHAGFGGYDAYMLRLMVTENDKRWKTFLRNALKKGFTSRQARTAWFSPPILAIVPGRF
jgi:hypothetical protein